MSVAALDKSAVAIKPSASLTKYIKNLDVPLEEMPVGVKSICTKNRLAVEDRKQCDHKLLINDSDIEFLLKLDLVENVENKSLPGHREAVEDLDERLLNLEDMHWLHEKVIEANSKSENKTYLHEVFEGTEIIVPKNKIIPRSAELEARCQKLRADQQNKMYQNMTKNIDNVRRKLPEDTLAYQMKMLNSQLIAVFQFVVSVLAGFAFGFIGVDLLIGPLDFGFRLLLGIMSALVIALAELYFLAKKLNEDLEFETMPEKKLAELRKPVKLD